MVRKASVIWSPTAFLKSLLSFYPPPQLHYVCHLCYSSSNQIYFYFALGYFSASSIKMSPTLHIEDKRQIPSTYLPLKASSCPFNAFKPLLKGYLIQKNIPDHQSQSTNFPSLPNLFIMLFFHSIWKNYHNNMSICLIVYCLYSPITIKAHESRDYSLLHAHYLALPGM